MYIEICKSLGFFGMAQRSYDRKLSSQYSYGRGKEAAESHKGHSDWIESYEGEETRGLEILQRQRRLEEEERENAITIPPNGNRNWLEDNPPNYESVPDGLGQQLEEIREEYWLHRQELIKLESEKPRGLTIDKWEMFRRCKNRQGLTLAWVRDSQACARHGGCCGRDCGCCDRPLKQFLMPTGDSRGKEKSGIYGHCTVECPCCIRFRGFYKPNLAKSAPARA